MSKRLSKATKPAAALPSDYAPLLADIKARVQAARIKAGLAANRELLALYWDIGRLIGEAQRTKGYGKQVVAQLAADLQREFPGMGGFSPLNVWRMRAFYAAYSDGTGILSQAVTESFPGPNLSRLATESAGAIAPLAPILQRPVAKSPAPPPEPMASLPWGHNLLLLHKLKKPADRIWYAAKAVEHGWSRNVLALQIESGLHDRQGKAVTNFKATLPPAMSDLAQGLTKDPYLFDFLTLREDANERAVEEGLVAHVEKFLLELGAGFALVGRQVHLEVGEQDFYLDLLFYHLKLRCYVVVDLKAREFTPEAAGKMNFYLSAVDDRFRVAGDQPSIGLILCRSKNRVIAEYALRDMTKPIGVSGYVTKLVDSLPKALKGAVPSVAELEKEFTKK
jgi:predicted nuclease of restriction endonuclease-like (RecB) superfamily